MAIPPDWLRERITISLRDTNTGELVANTLSRPSTVQQGHAVAVFMERDVGLHLVPRDGQTVTLAASCSKGTVNETATIQIQA